MAKAGANVVSSLLTLIVLATPVLADAAAPAQITLRHDHHLFVVRPAAHPAWRITREEWTYAGLPFRAPAALRVDGDVLPAAPDQITRQHVEAWDIDTIRATLQATIAPALDRPAGSVTISRDAEGAIVFDGVGMLGRHVDLDSAAALLVEALERGIDDVVLPMIELQPQVRVQDAELAAQGIMEVVTVGESDFSGSAVARRHNIAVGLSKFNGHLIPRDATFSFNEILGPVDASTGYKKELVILGERTLPDYGGGLCQVSTTAYRGAWEYGFPIVDRRNHSYSVRYYGPQGTDATIYPPHTDLKFKNDGPSALLMQTHTIGDKAYFIYYGTRDARQADVIGPYTWGHTSPPPDRREYTTEIPADTTRKVGERVPGLRAAWFRTVRMPGVADEFVESFYSVYQARPLFYQEGVEPGSLLLNPPSTTSDEVLPAA